MEQRHPRYLIKWVDKKFGEVNFYLTQFFSGHGYFQKYLYRVGKISHPGCIYCPGEVDDSENTFFECNRWSLYRCDLHRTTGSFSPQTINNLMMRDEETWKLVSQFVKNTLRIKKWDLEAHWHFDE